MGQNKSFWDSCVPLYDLGHSLDQASYIKVANNIVNHIHQGDSVLELACGTGILSDTIYRRKGTSFSYTATDYSRKMIDACQRKNSMINFEVANATNLQYDNKSFDFVIIANALHIIPNPKKALSEIHRVLKDNGLLFAPNFLKPITLKEKIILDLISLFGYRVFSDFQFDSYLKFLESNGFKVTEKDIYTVFRRMLYVACSKKEIEESIETTGYNRK